MDTAKMTENKKLKNWMIAGGILGLFVLYFGLAFYFSFHFFPGTKINGVDVSGKNVEAVKKYVTQEVKKYRIKVEAREDKVEVLTGNDIKLKPIFDGTLQKELQKQNCFAWPKGLFRKKEIEMGTMVYYDKEALKKKVKKWDILDEDQMKKPQNAVISDYIKGEGYKIIPEQEGTTVKVEKFLGLLRRAVLKLENSISLEEEGCYAKPSRTQNSKKLKKLVKSMNKYAGASITYQFGEEQVVLDGETISQWISVNKKKEAELSLEQISAYVSKMAETWDTIGKPKKLNTSYQVEVTVNGGDYGWRMDQEKETEILTKLIQDGETVIREPEYSKSASSHGETDYGNTYVEVNLGLQHLFYYKDGKMILETDFVSGNEAKNWDTPEGAYGLYYKERNRTLRGEGYATPVSYWMPFNGGVGFHDAKWRGSFGGSRYKRNGSHGCVNLPYSAAKTLYENIEAGCPVLVYNLPEAEIAAAQTKAGEKKDSAVGNGG